MKIYRYFKLESNYITVENSLGDIIDKFTSYNNTLIAITIDKDIAKEYESIRKGKNLYKDTIYIDKKDIKKFMREHQLCIIEPKKMQTKNENTYKCKNINILSTDMEIECAQNYAFDKFDSLNELNEISKEIQMLNTKFKSALNILGCNTFICMTGEPYLDDIFNNYREDELQLLINANIDIFI